LGRERQVSWSEYLDKRQENNIFVRIVLAEGRGEIEEFAVIYLAEFGERVCEIVRYDCGSDEAVHIHRFYSKPAKKSYLNREKSFETIDYFIENLRKNWRIYRSKFLER